MKFIETKSHKQKKGFTNRHTINSGQLKEGNTPELEWELGETSLKPNCLYDRNKHPSGFKHYKKGDSGMGQQKPHDRICSTKPQNIKKKKKYHQ